MSQSRHTDWYLMYLVLELDSIGDSYFCLFTYENNKPFLSPKQNVQHRYLRIGVSLRLSPFLSFKVALNASDTIQNFETVYRHRELFLVTPLKQNHILWWWLPSSSLVTIRMVRISQYQPVPCRRTLVSYKEEHLAYCQEVLNTLHLLLYNINRHLSKMSCVHLYIFVYTEVMRPVLFSFRILNFIGLFQRVVKESIFISSRLIFEFILFLWIRQLVSYTSFGYLTFAFSAASFSPRV